MTDLMLKEESISSQIILLRGERVMIDSDLAHIYGVDTKMLNRAVKRNLKRFPDDFMFQLSNDEWNNLKYQFGTSSWGGRRIFLMYSLNMVLLCLPLFLTVKEP